MGNLVTFGAEIKSVKKLANGTMDVVLNTQIQDPQAMASIFSLQDFCYTMLKNEHFTKEEEEAIQDMKADSFGKTPSQRLRNILYVKFEQDNKGFKDFQDFYKHNMESFINLIKNDLN